MIEAKQQPRRPTSSYASENKNSQQREVGEEGSAPVCPRCQHTLDSEVEQKYDFSFCPQCRFPLMLIAGKYKLLSLLAEGGFGAVYKAEHTRLNRAPLRVIKVLKREIFESNTALQRFLREVQVTAELSQRNSHIVHIYDDFGEIPHFGHFYVMEYLQGVTLRDWLTAQKEPAALDVCQHLFVQLCNAIDAAHRAEILHRDLKPDNIILIEQNRDPLFLKVLDFGIAKPLEESEDKVAITRTKGILGTPPYMSPEQCLGKKVDVRSDIYNMGLLLYELLTGTHALAYGKARQEWGVRDWVAAHVSKNHVPLHTHLKGPGTQALEDVISKALAKRPRDRFSSVDQLEGAFLQAVNSKQPMSTRVKRLAPAYTPALFHTEDSDDITPPTDPHLPPTAVSITSLKAAKAQQHTPSIPEVDVKAPKEQRSERASPHPPRSPETGPYPLASPKWLQLSLIVVGIVLCGLLGFYLLQPITPSNQTKKQRQSAKPPMKQSAKAVGSFPSGTKRPPPPQGRATPAAPPTKANKAIPPVRRLPSKRVRATQKAAKRRTQKRVATRRAAPKQKRRGLRFVKGCPTTPYFWTRIELQQQLLRKVRPRLSQGKVSKVKRGFCIGIRNKNTRAVITFGNDTDFVPCKLTTRKLPPIIKLKLQKETMDGIEPTHPDYCIRGK